MSLNILCLDDEDLMHDTFRMFFDKIPRYHISTAATWGDAVLYLDTKPPIDVLLLDLNLGPNQPSGLELLPVIKEKYPDVDVIIITGERDPELFKKAMSLGAKDYYHKPLEPDLVLAVEKLEQSRDEKLKSFALQRQITTPYAQKNFIGDCPTFLKVLEDASCLKGNNTGALIEGETGTGKELLAKYIYDLEADPKRPFIVVNCGALPKHLAESEFFGHEKGAFTGAHSKQIGKFQLAHGGDIFLDEINSLELDVQAKLLRVIQEKEFYPLGARCSVKVNVRIIVAGNANLAELVEAGKFREDLFYRLNVVKLTLPPLRRRREDIPRLIDHFSRKYGQRDKRKKFTDAALYHLTAYYWPGNVRELENMMQSILIKTKGDTVDITHLPEEIFKDRTPPAVQEALKSLEEKYGTGQNFEDQKYPKVMYATKRELIENAIRTYGNRTNAAKKLGITRQTIYNILHRKGLEET